ncbi:MAG: helix-turn-helix transcriptional regulator [Clostridia bacterium]|nr:helix-turn-helix transcriptional regulator [Clostridia bacterium]
MKDEFDISNYLNVLTEQSAAEGLAEREVRRRKEQGISQKRLSEISGVSYASVRRFEKTCEISLASLLKIARALGYLEDFNEIFKYQKIKNLKDYIL